MHLVGFTIEIHYDARSYKRQIIGYVFKFAGALFTEVLILVNLPKIRGSFPTAAINLKIRSNLRM